MNKYKILTDWFKDGYVPSFDWVYFNVVVEQNDNVSFNSVPTDRSAVDFIDGSRVVEMAFSIALCKSFDDGTSDTNAEAMQEFENIADWIEEQSKDKNFPNLGDNIFIEKIEVLETVPFVSIDARNSVAKYLGQFKITYIERR